MRQAAAAGAGVLLVSTEPPDLVETCDRIVVLRPGQPLREMWTDDPEDVLDAIYSQPISTGASHA